MSHSYHNFHSSYREMVLEHLFVGEVMKYCWTNRLSRIEMLKSQVDDSGYDIVLVADSIMRHIQLKASYIGAATPGVNINVGLAERTGGCVIWMRFDPVTLKFDHFLWFGGLPGENLPSLLDFKTVTHNKRNAMGVKTLRPSIKFVKKSVFSRLDTIGDVVNALFHDELPPET